MSEVMQHIADWSERMYGINLKNYQADRVEHSLEELMSSLRCDFTELVKRLDRGDIPAVSGVLDAITVQESYFFRDTSLFNFLYEQYLPALIERKIAENDLTICIWSAGCARGEEIYSIAILLNSLIPNIADWNIRLIGTDINNYALTMAEKGIYTKHSVRVSYHDFTEKNFDLIDNKYHLHDSVKHNVKFFNQGLGDSISPEGKFDVVLCRNVFIYLNEETIEAALAKFEEKLTDHGCLILGTSDFISFYHHNFKLKFDEGVTYYTKQDEDSFNQEASIAEDADSYVDSQTSRANELSKIQDSVETNPILALQEIDKQLSLEESDLLYQYKAQSLIAINDTETANEICDHVLSSDSGNYKCLYMKGLVMYEYGDYQQAESFFKKSLVSNPLLLESNYYLAQLALHNHDKKRAIAYLERAVEIAGSKNEETTLLGFQGETVKTFAESVDKELTILKREAGYGS